MIGILLDAEGHDYFPPRTHYPRDMGFEEVQLTRTFLFHCS